MGGEHTERDEQCSASEPGGRTRRHASAIDGRLPSGLLGELAARLRTEVRPEENEGGKEEEDGGDGDAPQQTPAGDVGR